MLWVPLPPEKRTALICVFGSFFSTPGGAATTEGSAMNPAQKRFNAAGVGGGVDSDCFLDFHQLRREDEQPGCRGKRDHREQIEFPGARANRVFIPAHFGQETPEDFRTETKEAGVALALARHVIAFASLQQLCDPSGAIALKVDVGVGTEHSGHGDGGLNRSLVQAKNGIYRSRPDGYLVAPDYRGMGGSHLGGAKGNRVPHASRILLNADSISPGRAAFQLRLDILAPIRRKHKHGR